VELGYIVSTEAEPMLGFERAAEFVPYTPVQNATGQPAMSVPLFWNDEGLPIGVHFAAAYNGEATLFRLAAQLEEARPWAHKRPPVSA
jgi:amidase